MVSHGNGNTTPPSPKLLEFIGKYGLKPETAISARLEYISHTQAKKLGFSGKSDAIILPYFDINGQPLKDDLGNDAARIRVLNPKPGDPKYLSRQESGTQIYIPPGLSAILQRSRTLVLTEGELKSLAGVQAGIPVAGIQGCHNWHDSERQYRHKEACKAEWTPTTPISMKTPLNPAIKELVTRADGSTRAVLLLGDSDLMWKTSASPARNSLYTLRNAIAFQIGARAAVTFCPPVCEQKWLHENRDAIISAIPGEKRQAKVEQLIDDALDNILGTLRELADVLRRFAPQWYEGLKAAKTGLDDWLLHGEGKPVDESLLDAVSAASSAVEIEYNPGQPDILLPLIKEIMGTGHRLDVFLVDGIPCTLEYTLGGPKDPPRIRPLDSPTMLLEHIGRRVRLYQFDKHGHRKLIDIPPKYAEVLSNSVEYEDGETGKKVPLFRPLKGVRTTPIIAPDGTIQAYQSGYHDGYIWHIPYLPEILRRVPERPTKEDVQKAVDLLFAPFAETPFVDIESVSTFFEMLLTMFSRFDIPTAPGFLISSPAAGTGKTYLASMATYLVYGVMPEAVAWPVSRGGVDDEEVRKLLTTLLLTRPGVILFDNVPSGSALTSPPLEAALTARKIKGRQLGANRLIAVDTTATIMFTGNNISLSGDSSSRFQYVRLNAEMEDAYTRAFKRDEDSWMRWADEYRPDLTAAFLTIQRAFIQSGQSEEIAASLARQSRFQEWQRRTRLVVIWMGSLGIGPAGQPFVDPETSVTTHNIDPGFELEARVVHALYGVFGVEPFAARDITAIARKDTKTDTEQDMLDALGFDDGRLGRNITTRVGHRLPRLLDRRYRGLSLQSAGEDKRTHAVMYRIVDHRSDPKGPQDPSRGPDGSPNNPPDMPTPTPTPTPAPTKPPEEPRHDTSTPTGNGNGHKDAPSGVLTEPLPDDFPAWTMADYGERILGVPRGRALRHPEWFKTLCANLPGDGERLGVFWMLCFIACKEWHDKKPEAKAIPLSQLYDILRRPKTRLFSTEDHSHNMLRLMVWIKALRNIPAPGWYETVYANPDDPIQRAMALHDQSDVIPPDDQHFRWLLVRWRKVKSNQS